MPITYFTVSSTAPIQDDDAARNWYQESYIFGVDQTLAAQIRQILATIDTTKFTVSESSTQPSNYIEFSFADNKKIYFSALGILSTNLMAPDTNYEIRVAYAYLLNNIASYGAFKSYQRIGNQFSNICNYNYTNSDLSPLSLVNASDRYDLTSAQQTFDPLRIGCLPKAQHVFCNDIIGSGISENNPEHNATITNDGFGISTYNPKAASPLNIYFAFPHAALNQAFALINNNIFSAITSQYPILNITKIVNGAQIRPSSPQNPINDLFSGGPVTTTIINTITQAVTTALTTALSSSPSTTALPATTTSSITSSLTNLISSTIAATISSSSTKAATSPTSADISSSITTALFTASLQASTASSTIALPETSSTIATTISNFLSSSAQSASSLTSLATIHDTTISILTTLGITTSSNVTSTPLYQITSNLLTTAINTSTTDKATAAGNITSQLLTTISSLADITSRPSLLTTIPSLISETTQSTMGSPTATIAQLTTIANIISTSKDPATLAQHITTTYPTISPTDAMTIATTALASSTSSPMAIASSIPTLASSASSTSGLIASTLMPNATTNITQIGSSPSTSSASNVPIIAAAVGAIALIGALVAVYLNKQKVAKVAKDDTIEAGVANPTYGTVSELEIGGADYALAEPDELLYGVVGNQTYAFGDDKLYSDPLGKENIYGQTGEYDNLGKEGEQQYDAYGNPIKANPLYDDAIGNGTIVNGSNLYAQATEEPLYAPATDRVALDTLYDNPQEQNYGFLEESSSDDSNPQEQEGNPLYDNREEGNLYATLPPPPGYLEVAPSDKPPIPNKPSQESGIVPDSGTELSSGSEPNSAASSPGSHMKETRFTDNNIRTIKI